MTESADSYLVAGCTPWARRVFDERLRKLPGRWTYAETPVALEESVRAFKPRLVFVLHWRWRVPKSVLEAATCIGFHLGRFSDYRGGTPLQHQIVNGETSSKLVMYRMTDALDCGDVYTTVDVPLHGSAEAIYARAMDAAAGKIESWLKAPWEPVPPLHSWQHGPVLSRRTPEGSRFSSVPQGAGVEAAYDFIRMLDAEGYPHAFIEGTHYRYTFRRAVLYDGRVECDCTITLREEDGE